MISQFRGKYRFLSNFFPSVVLLDGIEYQTVEHAYQAAKTFDTQARLRIRNAQGPMQAKRLGKRLKLRPDWEDQKLAVMYELLRQKFAHPHFRQMLIGTGNTTLVEGNTWGDTFWGICDNRGENNLGALLMRIRREIQNEDSL